MLLSIANLTNGLRGLKHNDDVPTHRFQAAGREPKLLVFVDVVRNSSWREHLLYEKYQQRKGEYRVYSARLMAGGVVLHKAIFVYKTRERRISSNQSILKGDKRATSPKILIIIFWYPANHHHLPTRITPSYPWGSIHKHTLICQVL